MSFLFATSHLPAVRAQRPRDDDADDAAGTEEGAHPLPRSGGVHACSHLPQGAGCFAFEGCSGDFVQRVLQAVREEAAGSPTAAALLAHVARLPGRITVRPCAHGLSRTETNEDGNVTLHLNPHAMSGATISHELGHVLQQAHAHAALQEARRGGRQAQGRDYAAAMHAGRTALHAVVPVADARDAGPEHKENEAMRISNIVNAERTASQMRRLPAERRTQAEFWARQRPRESRTRHQDNARPMPRGSAYGRYGFEFVKQALRGERPE